MKVYLSKSNLSDLYLVSMVRKIIQEEGYEVVEYHGGDYTHDNLLGSDCMVIVPAAKILNTNGDSVILINHPKITYGYPIGKGQYEQIQIFHKAKKRKDCIVCLEEIGQTEIYVGEIDVTNLNTGPCDWKIDYGFLEINSFLDNLKIWLSNLRKTLPAPQPIHTDSRPVKEEFLGEVYHNGKIVTPSSKLESFDETLHLACRRLYNR